MPNVAPLVRTLHTRSHTRFFLLLLDFLFKSCRSVQHVVFVIFRLCVCVCVYVAFIDCRAAKKLPEHVRLVCFGPDTWSCVYFWVKVRSVSAAPVGTRRHLLCLLLPKTKFCTLFLLTHTLAGIIFLLCVLLLGGNVVYVTCPKFLLHKRCEIESFIQFVAFF